MFVSENKKTKKKAAKQPYNQNATMIIPAHIYSLFYCSMLYEHAHFIDMHLFIYSLNCPLLAYSLLKNFNLQHGYGCSFRIFDASFIYQMAKNKWNFQLDDVYVSVAITVTTFISYRVAHSQWFIKTSLTRSVLARSNV